MPREWGLSDKTLKFQNAALTGDGESCEDENNTVGEKIAAQAYRCEESSYRNGDSRSKPVWNDAPNWTYKGRKTWLCGLKAARFFEKNLALGFQTIRKVYCHTICSHRMFFVQQRQKYLQ